MECSRGASAPLFSYPSPSPLKERGIRGVRLINILKRQLCLFGAQNATMPDEAEAIPWLEHQRSRMDERINPRLTKSVRGAG